ncbi:hypothetical protein L6452_38772 [Arctium lappa]|uniref:Uncharacterized protein n=1 Tax=Arctium lappa TaxID=4217 RepID=A0ACB8XQ04_ARCLA|nr:hypothetical protein L6452_38772 [Arctium lappa]
MEEAADEVQTEEPPSHVEGEKVADKATPSSVLDQVLEEEEEEEEEDEEDLDLQDQGKEQQADDDDDDEEDQSLWFSAANITLATTSKEVVTAWGRSGTSSGAPSQGKQKGIAAEGNLNIVSQSEGDHPSQS